MLKCVIALVGVVGVAVLGALASHSNHYQMPGARINPPFKTMFPTGTPSNCERPKKEIQAADVIDSFARLTHHGYLIQTRYKTVKLDVPPEYQPPPKPVRVSYLIVRRKGRVIAKFDAGIYSPVGNSTEAGFFPLLGNQSAQLIISQDISRTGVQWVGDFSKGFKVIFDGRKFQVGREADDMTISDLDGDGIQEITAPLTAFYGFEGWRLTTSDTPLPDIIFRYDSKQREYLPANTHFKECLLTNAEEADKNVRAMNEPPSLGRLMSIVLDYVFVGEERRGWKFFEETCKLSDKAKIKSDMQEVLKNHSVYSYVYKERSR